MDPSYEAGDLTSTTSKDDESVTESGGSPAIAEAAEPIYKKII